MYALLVPCYNAEKFIDSFLSNINKLTKPFDETIFYDDASTDNTYQLLKSKGCTVVKGDINRGPGYARNKLAEITTCEWFHFHDIDDGLKPDYLAKTAAITQTNKADVVLCNVNWYDAHSHKTVINWEYSNILINQNPITYTIAHPIGGINGLYRKSKFMETGGFNTQIRIWEDADLHIRLATRGATFYIIEEVLSYSWRYEQSASTNQALGWLTRLNLLQEYATFLNDEPFLTQIGKQAQLTASKLILSQQYDAAKAAFQLSETCKVQIPDNHSKVWKILKTLLPAALRIELRLLQLKLAFNRGKQL